METSRQFTEQFDVLIKPYKEQVELLTKALKEVVTYLDIKQKDETGSFEDFADTLGEFYSKDIRPKTALRILNKHSSPVEN